MSFFGKILDTLGLSSADAKAPKRQHPVREARDDDPTTFAKPKPAAPEAKAAPELVAKVDVVAQMEALAAKNPQKLNWKTSIVDLLKLLGIDSSYSARKELATELGCPAELMEESAKMNVWLHKTVLRRIAENGGNVPADLLD